jgi:hypothetical protein
MLSYYLIIQDLRYTFEFLSNYYIISLIINIYLTTPPLNYLKTYPYIPFRILASHSLILVYSL